MLMVLGLLLIGWGMSPRQSTLVSAAPLLLVTETPPVDPASPTPVPPTATVAITPVPPTNTPAPPTDTPLPATNTPIVPTDAPPRDREGQQPTATPTATPLLVATATVTPTLPAADPAISKSVSPASAIVGQSVTYTILVVNQGGSPASGVVVEDTLPAFLAIGEVSATRGQVTVSGQTVRVEIGDLAAGETVEIRVNARVTAPAAAPNNTNLAVVSSTSPDANPDNNRASVPLDALAPAALPTTSGDESALPLVATALGIALVIASFAVRRGRRPRGA
jgi:uncharacterized repeat protein (TIGR01451 family)